MKFIIFILLCSSCISFRSESMLLINDAKVQNETKYIKVTHKYKTQEDYAICVQRYSENGKLMHNTKRTFMVSVDADLYYSVHKGNFYKSTIFN